MSFRASLILAVPFVMLAACSSSSESSAPHPTKPDGAPIFTVPASQDSTNASGIAAWEYFHVKTGITAYGVASDGHVLSELRIGSDDRGPGQHYTEVRSFYPARGALVASATDGTMVLDTMKDSKEATANLKAMTSDLKSFVASGTPYGCVSTSVGAVGGCLAAAGCAVADAETLDLACVGVFIACGGSLAGICEDCGICNVPSRPAACSDGNYADQHCSECYSPEQCDPDGPSHPNNDYSQGSCCDDMGQNCGC